MLEFATACAGRHSSDTLPDPFVIVLLMIAIVLAAGLLGKGQSVRDMLVWRHESFQSLLPFDTLDGAHHPPR